MGFVRLATLSAALLAGLLTSSFAAAEVFHAPDDDGVDPGGPPLLASPAGWLNLYVDRTTTGPSAAGIPCVDGDGDEICAWEVVLQAGPGVQFGLFAPSPGVAYVLTASELRANGLSAVVPPLGPVRLGSLSVFSVGPATGGDVMLEGGTLVTAAFALEPIAPDTIATIPLPEPGAPLSWAAALIGLAGLARRRRRSHRGRSGAWLLTWALAAALPGLVASPAQARDITCSWEYPEDCSSLTLVPCVETGSKSIACGGNDEPTCKSGAPCDAGYGELGGFCTNRCGGNDEITCSDGCASGLDEYSLDPIRPEIRAGVPPNTPGIDEQIGDAQATIEQELAAALDEIQSEIDIPLIDDAPYEQALYDCLLGHVPDPALLDDYGASANYCFDTQAVAFDEPGRISWPVSEAPPGPRTVIGIHGRGGGGFTPGEMPAMIDDLEPAAEVRAYMVDYNANGAVSQTMRVYARRADGSWDPTPVFEGPLSDGTDFTIPSVGAFVKDFIAQLPAVGPIALMGASQGGFVAKEVVYRWYDALRLAGHEIVSVTFLGHPHFGIVIPPEDYLWLICSEALTQTGQTGGLTPQSIAQDCATARWMMGWNDAAAALGPKAPYLDDRSHPQIRWTSVAGDAGGFGGIQDIPFWEELTAVPRASVMGDGTVPTDSSLGLDTYGTFHIGDHQFDASLLTSASHSATELRDELDAADPDWLRHRALCGDVDALEGLSTNDVGVLQMGLADPGLQPPDFQGLCSVAGGAECDLLDAVRLQRQVAGLDPRGLQVCAEAAPPAATTTFFSDFGAWQAAIGTTAYDRQPTSAAYLTQADEVSTPPAPNAQLCNAAGSFQVPCTLTFPKEATANCRDFVLQAFQGITYEDTEFDSPPYPESLSIGDVDNGENDDFEIRSPDPTPLYAAGFTLRGNTPEAGESLTVIGQSGQVLGTLDETGLVNGFIGVVSSEPIASLFFDEGLGGDDIAIEELVFERTLSDANGDLVPDCDAVPTVQFTTNYSTWSAAAGTVDVLPTDAAGVALANEVPSPPGPNAQLCSASGSYQVPCTLTWPASSTGFCRDFSLSVQQGITFDDNELSYPSSLSIGDVNNGENDDFTFTFLGGPPTYAFGFSLLDNDGSAGEEIRVYDPSGGLIGVETVVPTGDTFVGITSNEPIGWIEFDEDAGGDDIAIRSPRMDCDGLP